MRNFRASLVFLFAALALPTVFLAQSATFQQLIKSDNSVNLFDGKATLDGGFILGGIAEDGSLSRPVMIKLDCTGKMDWVKALGSSSTVQNVFTRVAATADSGAVMVANVGQFQAYDIVVLRVDKDGNTVWRKIINQGLGDDGGTGIVATSDGGFIISGYTNTFGTESPGGSYRDVYLFKLDANGDLAWSKTYGNQGAYDEANGVIQTQDGGYAVCGRFIDQGTFYAFLLKTDPLGNPEFMHTYGDTLHANRSFALQELANGDFAMVGSTTLLQNNFQDWPDNFVLRTNASGDTLWTRGFYGAPNRFENPSSLVLDAQENMVIAVATASYPSLGFVPNKQMAIRFSSDGALQTAQLYNPGGSHYPVISKTLDQGYLITGFTNYHSTLDFTGNIIKTGADLDAGCFMEDVTDLTTVTTLPMYIRSPAFSIETGAVIKDYTTETSINFKDSVLCKVSAPPLVADFMAEPACLGDSVQFSNESSTGVISFDWDFGDTASDTANTSTLADPSHVYENAGDYMVRLIVSNGCQADTMLQTIQVTDFPVVDLGPDSTICSGETYTLDAGNTGQDFLWNDGTIGQMLMVQDSGLYSVLVSDGLCSASDSVLIQVEFCELLAIPNTFTPNSDGTNDSWEIIHSSDYILRRLMVFNRWGEMMYESIGPDFSWNGTFNGVEAPSDVYVYYLELEYEGNIQTRKGDITLLR